MDTFLYALHNKKKLKTTVRRAQKHAQRPPRLWSPKPEPPLPCKAHSLPLLFPDNYYNTILTHDILFFGYLMAILIAS